MSSAGFSVDTYLGSGLTSDKPPVSDREVIIQAIRYFSLGLALCPICTRSHLPNGGGYANSDIGRTGTDLSGLLESLWSLHHMWITMSDSILTNDDAG